MSHLDSTMTTPRCATPEASHQMHDDAMTVVESRSETVSLTDQTNLLPRKKVMAVFFGLSLCILVSCLDSTIVATALPTISAAFNAGSVVSWVPSAYFLTSTAFQPLCKCRVPLCLPHLSHRARKYPRQISDTHPLHVPRAYSMLTSHSIPSLQMGASVISSAERQRSASRWARSWSARSPRAFRAPS